MLRSSSIWNTRETPSADPTVYKMLCNLCASMGKNCCHSVGNDLFLFRSLHPPTYYRAKYGKGWRIQMSTTPCTGHETTANFYEILSMSLQLCSTRYVPEEENSACDLGKPSGFTHTRASAGWCCVQ